MLIFLIFYAVSVDALREIAWSGVPADMRPLVWRLLLVSVGFIFLRLS